MSEKQSKKQQFAHPEVQARINEIRSESIMSQGGVVYTCLPSVMSDSYGEAVGSLYQQERSAKGKALRALYPTDEYHTSHPGKFPPGEQFLARKHIARLQNEKKSELYRLVRDGYFVDDTGRVTAVPVWGKPVDEQSAKDHLRATRDVLEMQLQETGVDTSGWGKGSAKTIDHLAREIASGEASVGPICHADGSITMQRTLQPVGVGVYITEADGRRLELREMTQDWVRDGAVERSKTRNRDQLPLSLGEKAIAGEDVTGAALRALSEELGMQAKPEELVAYAQTSRIVAASDPMNTYPGIESHYVASPFALNLASGDVRYRDNNSDRSTSGATYAYIEHTDDLREICFAWQEMAPATEQQT